MGNKGSKKKKSESGSKLHQYAESGQLDGIRALPESKDIDVLDEHGRSPFVVACVWGKLKVAKFLAEKGADPHLIANSGDSALHYAVCRGHRNVARYLLNTHKLDVNAKNKTGLTPLMLASRDGRDEFAELLTRRGALVNATAESLDTALHFAAHKGHLAVVKRLVAECKANIDPKNNGGMTPFMLACRDGHTLVAGYLAQQGAAVDLPAASGDTGLHYACWQGNLNVVETLVHICSANINVTNTSGMTPLMVASRDGKIEIIRFLLKEGAKIGAQANSGDTALHYAAWKGLRQCCRALVFKGGADHRAVNNAGKTPLDVATASRVRKFLRSYARRIVHRECLDALKESKVGDNVDDDETEEYSDRYDDFTVTKPSNSKVKGSQPALPVFEEDEPEKEKYESPPAYDSENTEDAPPSFDEVMASEE